MTAAVQAYCQVLWDAREAGTLPAADAISRGLAVAVAQDVLAGECYDPSEDRRLEWAGALIRRRREGWQRAARGEGELEAMAGFLLGREAGAVRCGKRLAAGGDR